MSFYHHLSETERQAVIDLVEAGYGRTRLAQALTETLGRPVTDHQARDCIAAVRAADPTATPTTRSEADSPTGAPSERSGPPLGPARFELAGDEARVVSHLVTPKTPDLNQSEDAKWLIAEVFGLDPDVWEIVPGTLRIRSDLPAGAERSRPDQSDPTPPTPPKATPKRQYSCRLQRRAAGTLTNEQFAELVALRPPRLEHREPTDRRIDATQVICVADLQVGKKEAGGAAGFRARWNSALVNLERHFHELKVLGRLPRQALIIGLGDLIEQCVSGGQGLANTPYACDLTTSQQMEFALYLLDELGDLVADTFDHVHMVAVPGNHGERRGNGGRAFTSSADNYDLDLFRQLRFAYAKNPERYGHFEWTIATRLGEVVEASGTVVAVAHGHNKIRSGGRAVSLDSKAVQYWERAAFVRGFNQGFQEADVFITGHYHHLRLVDLGSNRLWIQAPAMEGSDASEWFGETGGSVGSTQGLLTFSTAQHRIWGLTIAAAEANGVVS